MTHLHIILVSNYKCRRYFDIPVFRIKIGQAQYMFIRKRQINLLVVAKKINFVKLMARVLKNSPVCGNDKGMICYSACPNRHVSVNLEIQIFALYI